MQLRLFNKYMSRCIACGHIPNVKEARFYIERFC